jgi:hypothetical protein
VPWSDRRVKRLWIGDTLVFDGTATSSIDITIEEDTALQKQGFEATADIFLGSTSQSPSDYLAGFQDAGAGTDRTPRYTGTCYMVFREQGVTAANAEGAYVGNSTSIEAVKMEAQRFPGIFSRAVGWGEQGRHARLQPRERPVRDPHEHGVGLRLPERGHRRRHR